MSLKRLACIACSAALLLGACSSNNPGTGTPNGGSAPNPDAGGGNGGGSGGGNGNGGDGNGNGEDDGPLAEVNEAFEAAEEAVRLANAALEDRAEALSLRLITTANQRMTDAVEAARLAVQAAEAVVQAAQSGSAAALGAATKALDRARAALDRAMTYQRTQQARLATAQESFAWYRTPLARYKFANGVAVVPKDGTNKVTIVRIPRTRDTSATDDTQVANTGNTDKTKDAFTDMTFKTVPYADGKRALVPSDDEFKVDGYTSVLASTVSAERYQQTGLKLASDGLVIRTGGTGPFTAGTTKMDFTDMRRKIDRAADDTDGDGTVENQLGPPVGQDGIVGSNGWDLAITFDEPQTMPVVGGETSWTGNGDFYWRAIVPAASSQLEADGDYYVANAFLQPDNFKDLGTYEVWLSNHIGVDRNAEPAPGFSTVCPNGVRGTSCPDDDDQLYLNYAAYGMFVYTADTRTFHSSTSPNLTGQKGRMQSIHYGYSAFADETGKRTTDIGQAIINGRFRGQTLAYAVKGGVGNILDTALLRGDATLTVTIPKTTGSGTIEGNLNNFEQWRDGAWWNFGSMSIALSSATISNAGAFEGTTTATGRTDLNTESGHFKGAFYGPRSERDDLEVAGSYTVGVGIGLSGSYQADEWSIIGSFGAKKRPPERLLTQ